MRKRHTRLIAMIIVITVVATTLFSTVMMFF